MPPVVAPAVPTLEPEAPGIPPLGAPALGEPALVGEEPAAPGEPPTALTPAVGVEAVPAVESPDPSSVPPEQAATTPRTQNRGRY